VNVPILSSLPPRVRAALAYMSVFAAVGSMLQFMPLYYRSLGFGLGEIGSILGLGALVSLLAAPSWGALSDRRRGSPMVLLAAAATSLVGTGLLAAATGTVPVILGAAVLGAGMAGFSPIVDARALETAGANRSGYGPLRAWGSVSYIVAILVTGAAVDAWGPRSLFAVLATMLVVTAIVGLALRPASSDRPFQTATRPLREAGRLFGPRGMGAFLLGAFLTWLGMSAILAFTPIRFQELGADAKVVGLSGAIAAGLEVPIMLRFPQLAARFGSDRLLIAGAVLMAARSVVAALAPDTGMLLASSIFGGFGFALFFIGGVTYVSRHVPAELAATAQGIFQGVGSTLSQVVATAAGGALAAVFGVAGLFAAGAGFGIVGATIIAYAVRRGATQTSTVPTSWRLDIE
jgi:PPP family 3-phenylpropionic acid transporter